MSKSRPESMVDPISVIEKYGADSLRLALVMGVSPGNDQNWGTAKAEANRNFCNKLWNVARYIEANTSELASDTKAVPQSAADHWILRELDIYTRGIDVAIQNFNFSGAYYKMYHLVWDVVADWYIEASKSTPNPAMLNYVLETILKLAHPFAPFVTETIWQTLHAADDTMLISASWPVSNTYDQEKASEFEITQKIIVELRQIKMVLSQQKGTVLFEDSGVIERNADLIKSLARLDSVVKAEKGRGLKLTQTTESVWFEVSDQEAKKYLQSLEDKAKRLENSIKNLKTRLGNKNYVEKAPAELIEETTSQLTKAELELKAIKQHLHLEKS
jgi:valyl-tRNA synthetase